MSSPAPDAPAPEAARRDHRLSFRSKLLFGVCGLVLLTGTAVTWLAHLSARQATNTLAEALFREASAHAVTETRAFAERATPVVETLSRLAKDELFLNDADKLSRQLLAFLQGNPDLSWVSCSDEAGTFTGAYRTPDGQQHIKQERIVNGKTPTLDYDVQPDGTWRLAKPEYDSGYDPRTRPFYIKTKAARRLVWMPPYIFYDQGVPGITCGAPLLDKEGKFLGVVTADFDLNLLSAFVARLSVSPNSRFFLYGTDESLLAYPTLKVAGAIGQRADGKMLTLADLDASLVGAFRGRVGVDPLAAGASHSFQPFQFDREGSPYLASTTAFRMGDEQVWVIGALAPKADFLSDVWRSQAIALSAAAGALLIAVVLAGLMARSVSTPVLKLIAFMNRVGGGDLDARADFGGSREFRQVADGLNRMIAELRDRLRLLHSLGIAMEVQQRLLPSAAPHIPGLDVAARSQYCDETGGDYYDYLNVEEVGNNTLSVALGDVTGHGIAAAMLMASARGVLRSHVQQRGSLGDLLGHVNRLLVVDTGGSRFMTMFLGVVDVASMSLRWASAGHDQPLLYDPTTGTLMDIQGENGLPLGVLDSEEYTEQVHTGLRPGQLMLIGTDGLWESRDHGDAFFGKERVRDAMAELAHLPAAEIEAGIYQRLQAFCGGRALLDDITYVVIKFTGPSQAS